MAALSSIVTEDLFTQHRRFLWGLCYRLTGSAADADDLVQETFVRAIERPPARLEDPLRPWLVRVAMNLGRDLLRRRRRAAYTGPWLPSPIETNEGNSLPSEEAARPSEEIAPPSHEVTLEGGSTEGRYELLESVSFAFLLALEALTPQQRAVLLLRDVFDYSVRETAEALDITESNVKTSHHRARRAMREYDGNRCIPTRTLQDKTRQILERFLFGLANQDTAAIESLLAADVCALSDGAGEFFAARVPLIGRERVMRFYMNTAARRSANFRPELRLINGLPALVADWTQSRPGQPPRMVLHCEVNPNGQITGLHAVVATRKLTAIQFPH